MDDPSLFEEAMVCLEAGLQDAKMAIEEARTQWLKAVEMQAVLRRREQQLQLREEALARYEQTIAMGPDPEIPFPACMDPAECHIRRAEEHLDVVRKLSRKGASGTCSSPPAFPRDGLPSEEEAPQQQGTTADPPLQHTPFPPSPSSPRSAPPLEEWGSGVDMLLSELYSAPEETGGEEEQQRGTEGGEYGVEQWGPQPYNIPVVLRVRAELEACGEVTTVHGYFYRFGKAVYRTCTTMPWYATSLAGSGKELWNVVLRLAVVGDRLMWVTLTAGVPAEQWEVVGTSQYLLGPWDVVPRYSLSVELPSIQPPLPNPSWTCLVCMGGNTATARRCAHCGMGTRCSRNTASTWGCVAIGEKLGFEFKLWPKTAFEFGGEVTEGEMNNETFSECPITGTTPGILLKKDTPYSLTPAPIIFTISWRNGGVSVLHLCVSYLEGGVGLRGTMTDSTTGRVHDVLCRLLLIVDPDRGLPNPSQGYPLWQRFFARIFPHVAGGIFDRTTRCQGVERVRVIQVARLAMEAYSGRDDVVVLPGDIPHATDLAEVILHESRLVQERLYLGCFDLSVVKVSAVSPYESQPFVAKPVLASCRQGEMISKAHKKRLTKVADQLLTAHNIQGGERELLTKTFVYLCASVFHVSEVDLSNAHYHGVARKVFRSMLYAKELLERYEGIKEVGMHVAVGSCAVPCLLLEQEQVLCPSSTRRKGSHKKAARTPKAVVNKALAQGTVGSCPFSKSRSVAEAFTLSKNDPGVQCITVPKAPHDEEFQGLSFLNIEYAEVD